MDFPPEFVSRMERRLGVELPAFLAALGESRTGLRLNTLRLSTKEFERIAPFPLEPLGFPSTGYMLSEETRAGRDPYHAAGLYYLQDPSAMVAGAVLDPHPGERVIDLAAAPGGKTTHIAAAMANSGLLVANDVSRSRALELLGNLERCGVRNTVVTVERVERIAAKFQGFFDRVLLDAPCSGEAMFARSAVAREDWNPAAVLGCAGRQADLLRSAAELVRPGGRLVYSTCTFSVEENEAVIQEFLTESTDFVPDDVHVPGAEAVELEADLAAPFSEADAVTRPPNRFSIGHAYRLWPHHSPGSGHFIAALRRLGDWRTVASPPARKPLARDVLALLRGFMADAYPAEELEERRLVERKGQVFIVPDQSPDFSWLNVVRPGFPLGTDVRGRFEPAHALVLGVAPTAARRRLDLTRQDPRLPQFLRGETLVSDGPDGWLPITVDGFALGWGKRVGSTIKNHYPKGLRWR